MKKKGGVKASLTRKIGPLPIWAWAGIAFIGIWYYRNKLSAAAQPSTTTSDVPTYVGPIPNPWEGPVTGPPIVTAPGPPITINVPGAPPGTTPSAHPGAPHKHRHRRQPPSVGKKGKQPPKTTKRHHKPKRQHQPTAKTTHHQKHHQKTRHRSTANLRTHTGGRTTGRTAQRLKKIIGTLPRKVGKIKLNRHRGGAKPHATQPRIGRTRHAHGVVGKAPVRGHLHPNMSHRVHTPSPPAHHVSHTPPRTVRSPARPGTKANRPPRPHHHNR